MWREVTRGEGFELEPTQINQHVTTQEGQEGDKEGQMGNVRDGWVTVVGRAANENMEGRKEGRMAIGRLNHLLPQWGGQAITRQPWHWDWCFGGVCKGEGKMEGEHVAREKKEVYDAFKLN